MLTDDGLIACRDPLGIRPLVMGKLGEATIFASETVALDVVGASFVRDVEPGELILVNDSGIRSFRPFEKVAPRPCIFEHVYFSRPDSIAEGVSVYEVRKNIGAELSREAPVEADYVVPVPDSGVPAASGFSQASGIPFELGIIRSHYVGRTFIQPSQEVRHLGVKLKHNANRALVDGKSIVLVDDSIVRGTTSVKLVQMMRDAGAREVHMRIASPPTRHSCFYGVDTPERAKLLAAQMNVEQMRDYINADSLAFISIEGLYRALGQERDDGQPQRCDACFTGDYPTTLTDLTDKEGPARRCLWWRAAKPLEAASHDRFEAICGQARAGHRRQPRHWRGDRRSDGRGRRSCDPGRPHRLGARGGRGADPRFGRKRDHRAARPHPRGSHRQACRRGRRALAEARRPRPQRRHARLVNAGPGHRSRANIRGF